MTIVQGHAPSRLIRTDESIPKVHFPIADGLDFGSEEGDSSVVGVDYFVVSACLPVGGYDVAVVWFLFLFGLEDDEGFGLEAWWTSGSGCRCT